jgi:hypothetical protein
MLYNTFVMLLIMREVQKLDVTRDGKNQIDKIEN